MRLSNTSHARYVLRPCTSTILEHGEFRNVLCCNVHHFEKDTIPECTVFRNVVCLLQRWVFCNIGDHYVCD
jgi:hypothetical protein